MSIQVELTYEMSKALGAERFEVSDAATVADIIRIARERFSGDLAQFEKLTRVASVALSELASKVHKVRGFRPPVDATRPGRQSGSA